MDTKTSCCFVKKKKWYQIAASISRDDTVQVLFRLPIAKNVIRTSHLQRKQESTRRMLRDIMDSSAVMSHAHNRHAWFFDAFDLCLSA